MATHASPHAFLALDLGAESGRAVLGRMDRGHLTAEEIRRFPNEPLRESDGLHWNARRLWQEMRSAISDAAARCPRLDSIGVDTWGVDYALLDAQGELAQNPFHYRDSRTSGVMERVRRQLTPEYIYGITGLQFLPFNTLYQLCAASEQTPGLLARARHLLTMPDLFHYWMAGRIACEYTNASTTQFLDLRTRDWSRELLQRLNLPAHFLAPVVQPGTVLGPLKTEIASSHSALASTRVIAPAGHDTGSAFAAVPSGGKTALLSSGTWSLLGMETSSPVANDDALRLNFTNEGGVCGTVRLLKNITGMWLLERCRKAWSAQGSEYSYARLAQMAATAAPLRHLMDPDAPSLAMPEDMPAAIAELCRNSGQSVPDSPGAFARAVVESLALKYRLVLESLERLAGTQFEQIRVVGGGSQNELLNQCTANATGCRVLAGPAEATALGNLAMQMVGAGAVESLDEAREMVARSFPPRVFEPRDREQWQAALARFREVIHGATGARAS